MTRNTPPIAVYYEHPDWFRPLFAELDRRGILYIKLDAACHCYDVGTQAQEYALVFNRMSASAYLRGHGHAIFYTRNYLAHLERTGTPVINGSKSFSIETSKALQLSLLETLSLPYPRTRVINCANLALEAARELSFPVVFKPNIGGRGAGILRFESAAELTQAVEQKRIELGVDSTALVQEFVTARGGHITRVETLGGKFLYAIKVYTTGENFNLCPAELCQLEEEVAPAPIAGAVIGEICLTEATRRGLKVEAYEPPPDVIAAVERIVAAAGIDVGGVEYLENEQNGQVMFYDINALSNFVADAIDIVGFDPHVRLVDYLEGKVA